MGEERWFFRSAEEWIAIAERLKIPQGAVSRMEKRSDLLLSTLREYVGALGGKLELRAVFPDADFELETLETKVETKSAVTWYGRSVSRASAIGTSFSVQRSSRDSCTALVMPTSLSSGPPASVAA